MAGNPYSPLPEATREHYAFDGWWNSGLRITEETLVTTEATRTLYAHWSPTEQVVIFDGNGGNSTTGTAVYVIGETYQSLPKATREGYDFDGWFTEATGGERLSGASEVTATAYRTIYAHWTLVEQVVTFWMNGGLSNHVYMVGANYGWLPEATWDGKVLTGWTDAVTDEPVECSDEVTVSRARVLVARWTAVTDVAKVVAYATASKEGRCTVRFEGREGVTYDLQRRLKLEDGTWATVANKMPEADGDITWTTEMPEGWESGFYRVVAEGAGGDAPWTYLVVDMSEGQDAYRWPVSYLGNVPDGGWPDEYKTTKLLLRAIPPGTFVMGSPKWVELGRFSDEEQHRVTLTKPFYMGVFEVTQRQWELAMGNRPSYFTSDYAARPVEGVSYDDILGDGWSFLDVLRMKTGLEFDLPTEAQWEYACRAGTTTPLIVMVIDNITIFLWTSPISFLCSWA